MLKLKEHEFTVFKVTPYLVFIGVQKDIDTADMRSKLKKAALKCGLIPVLDYQSYIVHDRVHYYGCSYVNLFFRKFSQEKCAKIASKIFA